MLDIIPNVEEMTALVGQTLCSTISTALYL